VWVWFKELPRFGETIFGSDGLKNREIQYPPSPKSRIRVTQIDRAMPLVGLGNYHGRLDTLKRVLGDFTKKISNFFSR